jgi:hypothetical protein
VSQVSPADPVDRRERKDSDVPQERSGEKAANARNNGDVPELRRAEFDVDTRPRNVGLKPSQKALEQYQWVRDSVRTSAATVNEVLRLLLTLTTALLGGSVAFLNQTSMHHNAKIIGCCFLLASLYVSLWGSLPGNAKLDPDRVDRDETIALREYLLYWKLLCLRLSCFFLGAALLTFVIGLAIATPPPLPK